MTLSDGDEGMELGVRKPMAFFPENRLQACGSGDQSAAAFTVQGKKPLCRGNKGSSSGIVQALGVTVP